MRDDEDHLPSENLRKWKRKEKKYERWWSKNSRRENEEITNKNKSKNKWKMKK